VRARRGGGVDELGDVCDVSQVARLQAEPSHACVQVLGVGDKELFRLQALGGGRIVKAEGDGVLVQASDRVDAGLVDARGDADGERRWHVHEDVVVSFRDLGFRVREAGVYGALFEGVGGLRRLRLPRFEFGRAVVAVVLPATAAAREALLQRRLLPTSGLLRGCRPTWQSNRAHDAVVDSEASPQASSKQDREHYVGIVGFVPDVELQHGWRCSLL